VRQTSRIREEEARAQALWNRASASWQVYGVASQLFLSVDHDGAVIATCTRDAGGFVAARLDVDDTGNTASITALYDDLRDTLYGAPFVSPTGYGFATLVWTKCYGCVRFRRSRDRASLTIHSVSEARCPQPCGYRELWRL
jgi:hypothetical protein